LAYFKTIIFTYSKEAENSACRGVSIGFACGLHCQWHDP